MNSDLPIRWNRTEIRLPKSETLDVDHFGNKIEAITGIPKHRQSFLRHCNDTTPLEPRLYPYLAGGIEAFLKDMELPKKEEPKKKKKNRGKKKKKSTAPADPKPTPPQTNFDRLFAGGAINIPSSSPASSKDKELPKKEEPKEKKKNGGKKKKKSKAPADPKPTPPQISSTQSVVAWSKLSSSTCKEYAEILEIESKKKTDTENPQPKCEIESKKKTNAESSQPKCAVESEKKTDAKNPQPKFEVESEKKINAENSQLKCKVESEKKINAENSQPKCKVESGKKTDADNHRPKCDADTELCNQVQELRVSVSRLEHELKEYKEQKLFTRKRFARFFKILDSIDDVFIVITMVFFGCLILGLTYSDLTATPAYPTLSGIPKEHVNFQTLMGDILRAISTKFVITVDSAQNRTIIGAEEKTKSDFHATKDKEIEQRREQTEFQEVYPNTIIDGAPLSAAEDYTELKKSIFLLFKDPVKAEAFWQLFVLVTNSKEKSESQNILVN